MTAVRTNFYYLSALLLAGCLVSCTKESAPVATSVPAQSYVDEVVSYMQNYSIRRKTIDWTSFKKNVNDKAQGAQSIVDTYPAIRLALTLLGDNHSVYRTAAGTLIYGDRSISCTDGTAIAVPANSKIGYVKVTSFSGSATEAATFSQSIQTNIKLADTDSIRGWIVDLRGNTGGNMWPMLAGIGPVLGEGVVGYFIDPDGNTNSWSYQKGAAILNQKEEAKVTTPYTLRQANPRVAVLTNLATASSGEAIAVSFKVRPNTRSFGTPTCGLSTSNSDIPLSDGAFLTLTQMTMADRTKTPYGNSVQPDEVLYASTAVDKAIAWLLQ